MISALSWIPRGANRAKPIRFELSAEDVGRIEELAKIEEEDENGDMESSDDEGHESQEEIETLPADAPHSRNLDDYGLPAELNMDNYDDEEDERDIFEVDNEEDDEDESNGAAGDVPNEMEVLDQGDSALMFNPPEEFDEEDDEIRPTDSVLLLAMTEDEYSHLEVQVLTKDGSLYTHHDIMLPDFPLCLAWMDCPPFVSPSGQQQTIGSYVAVGTFDPAIEIWNLDVLDPVEPSAVLGGEDPNKARKSSKKKKGYVGTSYLPGSHESSVMSLSWNTIYRQALASASADKTVKIWDVTTQACSYTFTHHRDKVNAVLWHPDEAWLLSTASFDKTLSLIDCRSVSITKGCNLPADIECLAWDPFQSYHLYASMENGQVLCLDIRNIETSRQSIGAGAVNPYLLFQAHDQTVSAIHFSSSVKGMFATASVDETVKVWDVSSLEDSDPRDLISAATNVTGISKKSSKSHNSSSQQNSVFPKCIAYKTLNVGKLFSLRFSQDDPFTLAAAGDEGKVAIWESDENQVVQQHFQNSIFESHNSYLSLRSGEDVVEQRVLESGLNDGEYVCLPRPEKQRITLSIPNDYSVSSSDAMDIEDWMNDNSGIATNRGSAETSKKKKKKSKKL